MHISVVGLGKLGAQVSSRRFKDEIKPMEKASEALFALKPVSFHYKNEIDPAGGDVTVLREEQRLEPGLLDDARELGDLDAGVGEPDRHA